MKNYWLAWLNTECQFCKKARMILFWIVLMFIADAFWFHLIIK